MSGGTFDHNNYHIAKIAGQIEHHIEENPQNLSVETIKAFKEAVIHLRKASIFVHRIDWLLAGDDGEDTFHKRLNNDLRQEFKL